MTRSVQRDHRRRREVVAAAGLVLAAVVVGIACAQTTLPASSSTYLRVIVVGATGDLAAKYLWVACFRLALEAWVTQGRRVVFIAAAREPNEDGERWKHHFFTPKWAERVCGNASSDSSEQSDSCQSFYSNEFVPMIKYATLDSAAQYKALARWVAQQDVELGEQGLTESGRLVYLAIPPRAFLPASTYLSEYLRPTEPNAFLRVVIEKPFGRDLASAELLASGLRQVLSDEEMLLMDHYAGKPGLRVIDPFVRRNGATLARIWDGKFISKIEIQMSETETCEHRLDYFDRNGIIRDVMANHLHLLLGVVVSPSLKHCSTSTVPPIHARDKLDDLCPHELTRFVRSLRPVSPAVIGQYDGYNSAAPHDHAHSRNRSVTATAAFAVLESSNADWAGTTISIAAAKATDTRSADVKVTFKLDPVVNDFGQPCSVRFTIQNGFKSSGESIQVHCASLGALQVPAAWSLDPSGEIVLSWTPRDSMVWLLGDPISAYDSLLHDAAHGHCDNFMKIEEVLAAWNLWSPIVHEAERISSESIITYPVGATAWMQLEGVTGNSNTCPVTRPWAPGSHPRRDVVDTYSAVRDT